MEIIIKPRGAGKTTELIKLAAKDFTYIVCRNRECSTMIFRMATIMDLDIPFPITYGEFIRDRQVVLSKNIKKVLIDDADDLLRYIVSGIEIKGITLTFENL